MIFNAIMNGLILDFFCFYCEDRYIVSNDSKNQNFWYDGTMVYAATVMVVNIAIL